MFPLSYKVDEIYPPVTDTVSHIAFVADCKVAKFLL